MDAQEAQINTEMLIILVIYYVYKEERLKGSSRNQSGADVTNLQEAADVVFVV